MAKRQKLTVTVAPFPPLEWDEFFWTARIVLPSWSGFQARLGAYGAKSSRKKSDGTARLVVASPDNDAKLPPTSEQADAYRYLLAHEEAIRDAVLGEIFAEYDDVRESYGYDEEEAEELMPAIERPEQLRSLIGLSTVHVLRVHYDGLAYVGFEFGCTWDEEHGLGVMTHRERVVTVGGASMSFEEWVGEDDVKAQKKKKRPR
jgi:hypothetical protein